MAISRNQITPRGIAQQSGLDTLSSIINYTGEYVNWGNALYYAALSSDTDYATTATNAVTDSLINSPASVIGNWYRFRTSGSPYTSTTSPIYASSSFVFTGSESGGLLPSESGMYQKLSLIKGNEYQVSIQNLITASSGTMYIKTYSPDGSDFIEYSSSSIVFPITNSSTGIITSTFTADTANDIIVIYFTSTSSSVIAVAIANISIQEKQEFLAPVYATDMWGNAHKVLRIAADQIISTDET
tara:strand:- start:193 stop:921 length:729 start_codon:yes stop_codon:yes gene_type:complete